MSDGNLRGVFKDHIPEAMWVPIETWSTGQGVPDGHFIFLGGTSGWVEHKQTSTHAVEVRPGQVGWLERYSRLGGRCFVAVRRTTTAGPRKGPAVDELWLFQGNQIRSLSEVGLLGTKSLATFSGGPAGWDWDRVRGILSQK